MYVEEIVAKRKGKIYKTLLVRESFRSGTAVKHRTIANISHLPQGCIEEIKRYLKGNSTTLDFPHVHVIDSKEYGASQSALSMARKLELDKIIFSRKVKWRERILAMIVGRLLYPGNEVSLTNLFLNTVLWECCGHKPKTQPDVNNSYSSLGELLSRQEVIQKKITDRHLEKGAVALLFLTQTIVEEEREYCEFPTFKNDNECRQRYKDFSTLVLSNFDGCPVAVKTFPVTSDAPYIIHDQIKEITSKLANETVILIGDQEMLNKVNIEEFHRIAALTQA